MSYYSKSGGSSSLDVATGTRRPTPPGTGEVGGWGLLINWQSSNCVCMFVWARVES